MVLTKWRILLCAPRSNERVINLLAKDQNITFYKKVDNWLKNVDIIISCTTGSISLNIAKDAIPFMKESSLFADFSSASSADKRAAANIAELNKIFYCDVVIMGGVNLTGVHTPLLYSVLSDTDKTPIGEFLD